MKQSNKYVQEYTLEIPSMFGKKFSVILETVKEKTFTTLNLSFSNGLYKRKFAKSILLDRCGDFIFEGIVYYGEETRISHVIKKESFEKDLDDAFYLLTERLQYHLLKKEVDYIVGILQNKGINVTYTQGKNRANLEFQLFNIDNPIRNVTLYILDGDIKYDFYDSTIAKEMKDLGLYFEDDLSYNTIEKWLQGASIIVNNNEKPDKK